MVITWYTKGKCYYIVYQISVVIQSPIFITRVYRYSWL